MIIGVYGIERSGKTTLVESFVKRHNNQFIHISRTKLMAQLLFEVYGKKFDGSQSEEEEDYLYAESDRAIRLAESKYDAVIIDCHAGYYTSDKKFVDFKRDEFHLLPDEYILLNTSPETVLERMTVTSGIKRVYEYTLTDIQLYRELEFERLKYYADKKSKKIHVIEGEKGTLSRFSELMEELTNGSK